MGDSPRHASPHHSQRALPRHRFRTTLAVLFLGAAISAVAAWLADPAPDAGPSSVAASLPPFPARSDAAASLPSVAPATGPDGSAAPRPEAQLQASTPTDALRQTTMLPPRLETKAPPNELPAWQRFAGAIPLDVGDKPRVAIVIDDLGPDRTRTTRVVALAPALTLSFLAYSADLPRLTEMARRAGHETMVHVPMEPVNTKMDMGPNGLATNQAKEEVLRRLDWDLSRFNGYVGINNHMGSRFTGDAQAMGWVMDELRARGLMFLDSRTIATTVAAKTAAAEGVPFAERDVFLDDEQTAIAVDQRLREVESIAKKRGTVIAIGHPHDATITALASWIPSLPQTGVVLVPLTEVVKARLGSR